MRPQIRSYELLVFVFVPKCLELLRASKLWSAADLKQHASGALQTPIQSIENLSNSVLLLLEDNCNLWIPLVLTGVHEIFKTQHGLSGFLYVGSCSCLIRFAPKIFFFVFNLSNTLLFLLFLWAFTPITTVAINQVNRVVVFYLICLASEWVSDWIDCLGALNMVN